MRFFSNMIGVLFDCAHFSCPLPLGVMGMICFVWNAG